MLNFPVAELSLAGLDFAPISLPEVSAKFDLATFLIGTQESSRVTWTLRRISSTGRR